MPAHRGSARKIGILGAVVSLAAALLFVFASPAAALPPTPWTGSGPGTTTVVSDGTTTPANFTYHMDPSGVGTTRTGTFETTATAAGTVVKPYTYSGLHAYAGVTAFLNSFVIHGTTTTTSLVNAGPNNCCTTPSNGFTYTGSATFTVQVGDVYG